jgi:DNA-binding CsgD family transcriptional regulator/tetratricopeptide (TPR) repeat protein
MLLERDSQMAALAEYAAQARRGEGRLVFLGGEAGVGKSALVEQLERDLHDARWAWSACDGLFTPRPLGPLFDVADQLGGELQELCRARASREDLFSALLREISTAGQLKVMIIEDAHWADEATIDLIRFLGKRIRSAPTLLITTYRDDDLQADHPLRLALGELGTQRSMRRISLAPLSADSVRILADGSGLDPAAVYRLTAGNPFYVTEVVQAASSEVPPSARDAVLARTARLGERAREVLEVAALIGARVALPLLESVAACQPADVDELLTSGLFTADGPRLRFRHEIARLAVESGIGERRRQGIHAGILTALTSVGSEDFARLAFHAEAAGDGPAVMRFATAAALGAAELASHREAAAQFERALRFPGGTDVRTLAGLFDGLANEDLVIDKYEAATEAAAHALQLWRESGDPLREADTLRRMSRMLWRLCRGQEAMATAQRAVAALEPLGPTVELAAAYNNLAHWSSPDALDLARRARAIAEALGDLALLSDALNTEGCLRIDIGQDGIIELRRALEVALAAGLQSQAGQAYANIFSNLCLTWRMAEAEHNYAVGVAFCDDHDMATYSNFLRGQRTSMLVEVGRWDEAADLSERLLRQNVASPGNQIYPLLSLGLIRVRRGHPAAMETLSDAVGLADATGDPQWIVPARLAQAEALWLRGQLDAARAEAELADDLCAHCSGWERGSVAVWLRRTGSSRPARGKLPAPFEMQIDGDWCRASEAWAGLGGEYQAAMVLLDAADAQPLQQALRIFTGLGAALPAQVARRRLRTLGVRSIPAGPRTATRADPLGLTRREREVLGLLCESRTNAEIAQRLYVSRKTVDHHVSAVLTKLGAPSREAAAAHARRLGLVN